MKVSSNITSNIIKLTSVVALLLIQFGCNSINSKTDNQINETLLLIQRKIILETDSLILNEPKITCIYTEGIKAIEDLGLRSSLLKISEYPEVKDLNIVETTFCFYEFKKDNKRYYAIRVLLDKETHFSGQYIFYVDIESNNKIFIEDFLTNKLMSIEDYRSTRK